MPAIASTIRKTSTAEGAIILDLKHGQLFRLNAPGARILELVLDGHEEAQVAAALCRDYGADPETVRSDLRSFLEVLNQHHIFEPGRP